MILFVLQQHDALFSNLLRHLKPPQYVDHALFRRIVYDTSGEHRAQDAMHVVVQFGFRNLAGFDGLLEFGTVEDFRRFFLIETCG